MLHVTVIILVCCAFSAPSKGIAITRRKNYLFEDFCLFEEKVPKVAEVFSTSFYNVEDDQFPDCVKHKITYRLSCFKNFFINQYQNRKNNYCSIMDSVLERKKKESGSSVELTYRKRNLLWTRKGVQSLKTLKPNLSTTTSLPIEKHTLNYIEKKRFFALKKAKTHKRKKVRRYTRRPKTLREQISSGGPPRQVSNVIWNDYFEGKLRERGQAFPRFHYSGKFIEFKKTRGNRGSVLKNILRGRESAGGEATHVGCTLSKRCHNYVLKKRRENARSVNVRSLNKESHLLNSNYDGMGDSVPRQVSDKFIQGYRSKKIPSRLSGFRTQLRPPPLMRNHIRSLNQLVYDSKLKGNDKINFENYYDSSSATDSVGLNECEDNKGRRLNKKEKKYDYDNELDISESCRDGNLRDADYPSGQEHLKTKQEMGDFFRKILKPSADCSTDLKEGVNSAEESKGFSAPKSTTIKSFLKPGKLKKKMPTADFDFPDYNESYDAATDILLKNYTPSQFLKSREFKFQKNVFSEKGDSKNRQKLRSASNRQTSMNLKRSLLSKKSIEREKKFCVSKCSSSCGVPRKCWKSAPLLCIPYIRKGQDDLLRYLISVMQKMLGKPYPQKIDIFENTKYKPYLKKCPPTTCEDIIPQELENDDDDDDDVDAWDTNLRKTTPQPSCDSCSHSCSTTPAPSPNACSPVPTPCFPSSSCPKECPKNSTDASPPSFGYSLPNLNQIYTEPTNCPSDKYFQTIPPFLLPLSSIIQSGASKNSPETSPCVKPTPSTVKPVVCNPNKATLPLKAPNRSESIRIFSLQKNSPGYVKEAKKINSDLPVGNDQSYQRPKCEGYQEEMKPENRTETTPESKSTPISSTSSEPFLFELPKSFSDDKHVTDFSNPKVTNSFARRDLNIIYEYNDQIFDSNNPTNFLSNTLEQTGHRIPSKRKDHSYKPSYTTENDIYGSFPRTQPEECDKPQIDKPQTDKPSHSKHRHRKSIMSKKKHSLKRHKREDNYNNIDDFVNYDGYLYGTDDNGEDYEKRFLQQLDSKESNSDVNRLADDYNWTPLEFEIFSELAKIVTETEANIRSRLESDSAIPEPSPTDLTVAPGSTTDSQMEKNSLAVTTEKISTTVRPIEETTIKTTSSAEMEQSDTSSGCKQTRINKENHYNPRSSSTVEIQDFREVSQEKELDVGSYLDTTEDGQVLTTVGTAYIVKGPKKQMTKPCPKMYTRVYPDSVPVENEKTYTTTVTATDTAPKRSILLKTTQAMTSATPDIRLQLLAVCEGYLEVVKFVKSQNQSFGGELDSDLSSYCENIISQSFSQQTESPKTKKQEVNLPVTGRNETSQNASKKIGNLTPESKSYESSKPADPVLKRDLDDYPKLEAEKFDKTNVERNETIETPHWRKRPNVKKSKRKKKERQLGNQKLSEGDDEFLKKGMTKEQMELLSILKKRKRALLNWLFNSKEDQIQPEVEETEYFSDDDDESAENFVNSGNNSGTVRPRGVKSSVNTEKVPVTTKDSIIPVYAKEYGYDKGGELKQVEVLWQKVNDETHEKQTFKNLSVLALVLTSTIPPDVKKNYFFDINGYVNEDVSEIRTKKKKNVAFAAEELQDSNNCSVGEKSTEVSTTAHQCNRTFTYANKPEASSITGTVINHTINTTKYPNITRKIAGKLNKAKGLVEEYTIEFWNYAVYILPIMFSILFLFCCACCAIHILRNKKIKRKKKKKKFESTDDDSSEESCPGPEKKRRDKSKRSKHIWKVWKKSPNKSCLDNNDEISSGEKKRSFLRFLKTKKNNKIEEGSSVSYCALPEYDGANEDNHSETAERRELIALLEELKKIEMEQVGEKKEQKSVHVQYMVQDHDESVFKSPEMAKNYPFFSKNCPFHELKAEEYGICRDAELKELLPCECGYSSQKRNYLRNYGLRGNENGRCERFFNIFRNAGMSHHQYEKKKKFTEKDRNFIFDNCRSAGMNDERNEAGFTVKLCDMSQFNLAERNPNDWVGEVEHFKSQMMKKKHVRLKDDGVLCRL